MLDVKRFFRILVIVGAVVSAFFYNVDSLARTSYSAPAFRGITTWLNSEPLVLKNLKGKVVLVDFWSYQCPHCLHSLPYVTSWYSKYAKDGLVIIGVHVKGNDVNAVKQALKEHNITYPVAIDSNLSTVKSFHARQLPTFYLINREGKVVYTVVGQDNYSTIEQKIKDQLKK